ncbi:predicted protein [Naegleria gruberi]|uniref:Predicted protein n=1 Tax=Naegleria gruberi TaxID=5762 RepID=D2VCB2_NAEGR|nr:uncharacterized protein NAEGRDRAFT_66509 [Naegleria gruberi]EFC45625.1 predicted protein [Naegleria gruberi]|eukprot:XP_002678369.1 predicted protein [Naegleria gruberi strain NEG-M]
MCPYCLSLSTLCDRRHVLRAKEELSCILSIPPSKIVICFLHLRERIMERLLIDSILTMSSTRKFLKTLKSIKNFQNFSLRQLNTKKGILYRCYLIGNMVKSLLKSLIVIKKFINPMQYELMTKFKRVVDLLNVKERMDDEQYETFMKALKDMQQSYCRLYVNGPKSWYMHILFHHVPSLLKMYGSLKPFETQGFEGK